MAASRGRRPVVVNRCVICELKRNYIRLDERLASMLHVLSPTSWIPLHARRLRRRLFYNISGPIPLLSKSVLFIRNSGRHHHHHHLCHRRNLSFSMNRHPGPFSMNQLSDLPIQSQSRNDPLRAALGRRSFAERSVLERRGIVLAPIAN